MTKKICAMMLLTLAISACDSNSAGSNSNANNANANVPAQASSPSPAQASPTVASSPTAEPAAAPLKAGDKVKIMISGTATEATVVSVDDKLGTVTVRVPGESKVRTVPIADVTRQ